MLYLRELYCDKIVRTQMTACNHFHVTHTAFEQIFNIILVKMRFFPSSPFVGCTHFITIQSSQFAKQNDVHCKSILLLHKSLHRTNVKRIYKNNKFFRKHND